MVNVPMRTNEVRHSYPLSPQWGQYCTWKGCNLNRRRVIQCYTVTLWDFIVVVQYSLMAMLADERYIGEEKTSKIKKRRMKLSIERGVKNSTSESRWNLWFFLTLYCPFSPWQKKSSTCWPHTHADIHSHTSTLQSSILFRLFWKRNKKVMITTIITTGHETNIRFIITYTIIDSFDIYDEELDKSWTQKYKCTFLWNIPMSTSLLCCTVSPQLCSCSGWFRGLPHRSYQQEAPQIWSELPHLDQGCLQQRGWATQC